MFTVEQIKAAHSKVKSGADFPNYVQDLIKLGVTNYETHVEDGHSVFNGKNDYTISMDPKYSALKVADTSDKTQFQKELKEHQQGKTDYPTFCSASARLGVEKWISDLEEMTCTYYDKTGNKMLIETIPGPKK